MRVIFLTGHRKSGTTMLHKLFDGHGGLLVYPIDISVLYAYFPCFNNQSDLSRALKRIELVLKKTLGKFDKQKIPGVEVNFNFDRFIDILRKHLSIEKLDDRVYVTYAIVQAWLKSLDVSEDAVVVIKETSQAIHFQEFLAVDPSVKFINLIRDPRDNYAAIKSGVDGYYSKLGEDDKASLASLINRVKMDFKSASLFGEYYQDNFISLRFEDLISAPEGSMKKLATFAGVEYHQSMLVPTVLGKLYTGNSYEGDVFQGISGKNVGRWRERISDFEAKVIEFWLRSELEDWGYPLDFDQKDSATAFAKFYDWYNCKYFYFDSFCNAG